MTNTDASPQEKFALTTSRHFTSWLAERQAGIAFTTYQAQKVFLLGLGAGGRMSVFERARLWARRAAQLLSAPIAPRREAGRVVFPKPLPRRPGHRSSIG